tara:strand:+ start:4998 stop:5231 length:234 start_codon:yes stop_codon:yes gene_type:complete
MTNNEDTMKRINPEQLATLRAYADAAGEEWKKRLALDWMRAGTSVRLYPHHYATLHGLRNMPGAFKWLDTFAFSEEG